MVTSAGKEKTGSLKFKFHLRKKKESAAPKSPRSARPGRSGGRSMGVQGKLLGVMIPLIIVVIALLNYGLSRRVGALGGGR